MKLTLKLLDGMEKVGADKIEGIRLLCRLTGWDLRTSKNVIEKVLDSAAIDMNVHNNRTQHGFPDSNRPLASAPENVPALTLNDLICQFASAGYDLQITGDVGIDKVEALLVETLQHLVDTKNWELAGELMKVLQKHKAQLTNPK